MKSRKSLQRETILRVVSSTKTHPGADWVYEQARREIPRISLGTVYRNLRILVDRGEIKELSMYGSQCRFDADTRDHYHFRCEKCGNIFDLFGFYNREIELEIARKTGFKIKGHNIEFSGFCTGCQKNKE